MEMKENSAKIGFFVMMFIALSSMASAETYYADVNINVMENGDAVIEGISNHPMLRAGTYPGYTSKEKTIWTLNISPEGTFSDYLVEIRFPKSSVLNYLKMPSLLSISEEAGSVIVTSSGSDSELFILAQYRINASNETGYAEISLVLFAASAIMFFYWFRFLRKGGKKSAVKKITYNPDALTDRQKQIMDMISRNNGSMTQSQLQKTTGLPKASLSRNVDGLIRKGILTKEEKGMTNLICIKKEHS